MNSQSELAGLELSRLADQHRDSPMDSPSPLNSCTPTNTDSGSSASPHCRPIKDTALDTLDQLKASLPSSDQVPLRPLPPHACPEPGCGRQFNRKYTLAEHIKAHTGERPHVCPLRTCGKRFSTSGNLSRHKRLHGYIEPLKCPVEGCVCAFPSNKKLEKHLQFHYGTAVKACSIVGCGKTFSTTGNLNRHLKHQHTDLERRTRAVSMRSTSNGMNNHSSPTSSETWTTPALLSDAPQFRMQPLTLHIPPPPQLVQLHQRQQLMHQQQQFVPVRQQELQLPPMGLPVSMSTKSCSNMFEEVWSPEMLDTLVTVLHDPKAR